MEEQKSFYKAQLELHKTEASGIFKQMGLLSVLRILVFLLTAFGIYLTYLQWQVSSLIGVLGIGVFLFLL